MAYKAPNLNKRTYGYTLDILNFEMSYHIFKIDKYIIFNKSQNIRLKSRKLIFY